MHFMQEKEENGGSKTATEYITRRGELINAERPWFRIVGSHELYRFEFFSERTFKYYDDEAGKVKQATRKTIYACSERTGAMRTINVGATYLTGHKLDFPVPRCVIRRARRPAGKRVRVKQR